MPKHHTPSGRFLNPWPTRPPPAHNSFLRWAFAHRTTRPRPVDPPRGTFARTAPTFASPRAAPNELMLTWVGHSTFLIQVGGLNILSDPVWSDRASPLRFLGPKRWVEPGIPFDELPPIDVIMLSHDHYDHLDSATVHRLAERHPEARWLSPLRLGRFLRARGADAVTEMDWWEELTMHDARFICTPAQHYSARSLRDRRRSLWCSWTILCEAHRVFFAGDTGYFPEFGTIGERYGPFDVAMMPIGGYLPRDYMRFVHMDPADAVRAFRELNATRTSERLAVFVPMHWGTFKLTDEAMDEPPTLLEKEWRKVSAPPEALWLLMHGETRRYYGGVAAAQERSEGRAGS